MIKSFTPLPVVSPPAANRRVRRSNKSFVRVASCEDFTDAFTQQQRLLSMEVTTPENSPSRKHRAKPKGF